MRDEDFMAMALDLARLGLGRTSPNPAVGAVIVKKGKVIGTGFHRQAGLPHAEVEALRDAACRRESVKGATLYVNLEPCAHFGKTPPCAEALIEAGLREVVIGMRDPDRKVSGRGVQILRKAGIRIREGILKKESLQLNEAYVKHRQTGRPLVILKVAAALDGTVIPRKGGWITSSESRSHAHAIRDQVDAILVGGGTILRDNPRLTTRLVRGGKDPIRVILDGRRQLPRSAKIFHLRSKAPTWIASTLAKKKKGRIDLPDLLKELGRRGVLSLLVEGGPTVWRSFIDEQLADKIMLYLAPPKGEITYREVGPDLLISGNVK